MRAVRLTAAALLLACACIERPFEEGAAAPGRAQVDRSALRAVLVPPPSDATPVGAVFGNAAERLAYKLEPPAPGPGQRSTLTFSWRCPAELDALLGPRAARAARASVSYSELEVRGREVRGTLRFALADLRTQVEVDAQRLPAAALERLLLASFLLKASGQPCALQPGSTAAPDGPDGAALHAAWLCPAAIETLSVRVGFLDFFPAGHAHLSRIGFGDGEVSQRVAQVEDPSFAAPRTRRAAPEPRPFLLLGIAP